MHINNNNNKSNSFMSFSNYCLFLDELENERKMDFESLESENFTVNQIENLNNNEKAELKNQMEFFTEISPIAHNPNKNEVKKSNAINSKNAKKSKNFITADSQFSSLVNIGNKNNFSSFDESKSNNANSESAFSFVKGKGSFIAAQASKSNEKAFKKSNNDKEKEKKNDNDKKHFKNAKLNQSVEVIRKKNKEFEKDKKSEDILNPSKNANAKAKGKKAYEKEKVKGENLKLFSDSIRKNKELNLAKFTLEAEKEIKNSVNNSQEKKDAEKFETFKAAYANANVKSVKKAELSISNSTEGGEEISFLKFLNLLQKGMNSFGLFSSEANFQDFKRELEKLNVSLKAGKFNLIDKQNELKAKMLSYSEEKKENIFFYYYVSINLILQSLVKSKIDLKINKIFQTDSEQIINQSLMDHISSINQNNKNKNQELFRSPSTTKNRTTKEYIQSITSQKQTSTRSSAENSANKDSKFNNQPKAESSSASKPTEEKPLNKSEFNNNNNFAKQSAQKNKNSNPSANENIYVFKPLNSNNHFDIKNKIIQAQNNLVFMPYSKNIANSFAASDFAYNNKNHFLNMQLMNENNRYLIPPRPQMLINKNPFFSKIAVNSQNGNAAIIPSLPPVNNYLGSSNILPQQKANNSFTNNLDFNPMLPMVNRCFGNHAYLKGAVAMNNFVNLNNQQPGFNQAFNSSAYANKNCGNYKNNNFKVKYNNHNVNEANDKLLLTQNNNDCKSESDKAKTLLNSASKNSNEKHNFEILFAKESVNKTNDNKPNYISNNNNNNNNNSNAQEKAKFNEPYSLNENSNSKYNNNNQNQKQNNYNKADNKKWKQNYKDNKQKYAKYEKENKENDSRYGNKLLGIKRNQNDDSAKNNNFDYSKERNLKKIKHS